MEWKNVIQLLRGERGLIDKKINFISIELRVVSW